MRRALSNGHGKKNPSVLTCLLSKESHSDQDSNENFAGEDDTDHDYQKAAETLVSPTVYRRIYKRFETLYKPLIKGWIAIPYAVNRGIISSTDVFAKSIRGKATHPFASALL